ncbi:hypothetical protein PT286_05705 [Neisseriaceae bacterium ESL0693]|nr:hypothetical protein [Neisseriaceae bacterium ESL0693]
MYSYTQKILNLVEIKTNKAEKIQLSQDIHQAICELSYSLQGISHGAYAAACAVHAEDKTWYEAKALEKLQAVCILAELLNFMVHAQARLNLNSDIKP